jgi:hypothetical protein
MYMSGQADKCNEFFGSLSEHLFQNTSKFPFPPYIKYISFTQMKYETPILCFLNHAL